MVNLQTAAVLLLIVTAVKGLQADPITTYLTDDSGRYVFFHGVNVVYK